MKVCGSSSQTSPPAIVLFATRALKRDSRCRRAPGRLLARIVDQPEAGIVAGLFVFGAGVAEADDQANGMASLLKR